jgi:hypothetical protein
MIKKAAVMPNTKPSACKLDQSSYSQSNPIGLTSNRYSIDFKGYRFKLLELIVKGPKSIVF